jgi:hypothetical protein
MTRPLACCDCGTTDPTRFDPEASRSGVTRPWPDTHPLRWTRILWAWRMSGRPFGSECDFGFCLRCAVKARVRSERRAKRRARKRARRGAAT